LLPKLQEEKAIALAASDEEWSLNVFQRDDEIFWINSIGITWRQKHLDPSFFQFGQPPRLYKGYWHEDLPTKTVIFGDFKDLLWIVKQETDVLIVVPI
jgi:hypothetical protein